MVHDCCLSKPILLLSNGLVAFCYVLKHRQKQTAPPYGPQTRIAEESVFSAFPCSSKPLRAIPRLPVDSLFFPFGKITRN